MSNKILRSYVLIVIWPAFVLLLHFIATITGYYFTVPWLDTPMHFLGGISIALSTFFALQKTAPLPRWTTVLLMITMTALIAVGWEWLEFLLDYYFHSHHQISQFDTMKDLFMGILGAILTGTITYKKLSEKSES